MRPGRLLRWGDTVPYGLANDSMHRLAEQRLAGAVPDTVILLEHAPVFTGGRRARPDELLWAPNEMVRRGVEAYRSDRGGAFTFHGPGQLVVYPIIDLGPTPDAAGHLRRMEEVVIRAAHEIGVEVHRRMDVQTGVWSGDRKVCAIGVRLMRARVTLHGFAINCDTDLTWFEGIVACGLPDHGVTSLSELAGRSVAIEEIQPIVEKHLAGVFDLDMEAAPEVVSEAIAQASAISA